MNAKEFLQYQLDRVVNQVRKAVEGIPEDKWDTKIVSCAMSPREQMIHLAEVCEAVISEAQGKKYEWGNYKPKDTSVKGMKDAYESLRTQALDVAFSVNSDEAFKTLAGYIVSHEAYHVGQLALIRMCIDPKWDPYSLYK